MKRSDVSYRLMLCALVVAVRASFLLSAEREPGDQSPAATLQSGLQAGERVQTFYVRAITGPLKNKSVCYVCRNGDRPVVMIFVRRITPELKKLLKGIDAEIDAHRAAGLRGFGVFLAGDGNPGAPGLPQVQTLAFDEKINLPLTIAAA